MGRTFGLGSTILGGRSWIWCTGMVCATLVGCARNAPPAQSPEAVDDEPWKAVEQDPSDLPAESRSAARDETGDDNAAPEEGDAPQFTPGMSVMEATNAVPLGSERINLEQERLAQPLMEAQLYEPCGLQGHHHFTVKVAVWDGRAVGLDVATKPNDAKLESCLRQQIQGVEWADKAKSLNTVEYNY